MNLKLVPALLIAVTLLIGACGSDAESTQASGETAEATRLWIKSDLVDCEGVAPQTCMQIAESEDGEHELFYDQIEGFTFVEGTSYVIDVAITEVDDPPADGSSLRYELVKVVEENPAG